MRRPDDEVKEVVCSVTGKPMPKVPAWMAGIKVKFVRDEARPKHGIGATPLDAVEGPLPVAPFAGSTPDVAEAGPGLEVTDVEPPIYQDDLAVQLDTDEPEAARDEAADEADTDEPEAARDAEVDEAELPGQEVDEPAEAPEEPPASGTRRRRRRTPV